MTLFAAAPPPEDHGFSPSVGHWRKQVTINDIDALWESRPVGTYRGEPCLVLDDLSDRLHIAYLGMDERRAQQLGYWQVDRGVFEVVVPRHEVRDLAEDRHEFPLTTLRNAIPRAADPRSLSGARDEWPRDRRPRDCSTAMAGARPPMPARRRARLTARPRRARAGRGTPPGRSAGKE